MVIMDIITCEGSVIMYKKYFGIALISLITLTASAFAGYFTTLIYTDKTAKNTETKKPSYTQGINAQVSNASEKTVVSEKTEIKKTTVYKIGAEGYKLEVKEEPGLNMIGLDRAALEEVIKKDGYKLDTFSGDKVEMIRIVENVWPPNKFVLREEGGLVSIYKSSEDGKLQNVQTVDLEIGVQPDDIQERLKKGLIFNTQDEAEEKLYELNS